MLDYEEFFSLEKSQEQASTMIDNDCLNKNG
jgi:hypothetical protein